MKKTNTDGSEIGTHIENHFNATVVLGFTDAEAIDMMADTLNITSDAMRVLIEEDGILWNEAYEASLTDEERWESEREEYEMETASENAWLTHAEYDPEAQDEMHREDMIMDEYSRWSL